MRQAAPLFFSVKRECQLLAERDAHEGKELADLFRKSLEALQQAAAKWAGNDRRRYLRGLASAYFRIEDTKACKKFLSDLASEHPNDIGSRLDLFDLALQTSDEAAMAKIVEDMREIEGTDGSVWRYCRLSQILRKVKPGEKHLLTEARVHLTHISLKRPGWSRLAVCEGQLSEFDKDYNAAIKHFQQAIYLGERNPVVVRHAVELLMRAQRFAEADQLMQKLAEASTNLGELNRHAAELALFKQDTAQAFRLAHQAVKRDSKDYKDHMWLGHMLWATGQSPKEAEEVLRKAIALAKPDEQAVPWVVLVQFLVRIGEKDRAEKEISVAAKSLSKEQGLLALPVCYEIIQRRDEAKKLYDLALVSKPSDVTVLQSVIQFYLRGPKPREAVPYLERLESLKAKDAAAASWALRVRAILRASEGGFQNMQEALTLLGVTEDGDGKSGQVSDLRTRAFILAAGKSLSERRQAVAILENLQKRQALGLDEEFLLARLYDSIGDWKKAHQGMRRVVTAMEEKLMPKGSALEQSYCGYLSQLALSLIRQKQTINEADVWLEKLERKLPDTLQTLATKARVLKAQGRDAQVAPALLSLAKSKETLLPAVARELEQMGEVAAAEKLYQQMADSSKKPEDALILAAFYGRHNRTKEALEVCAKARATCSHEAVAQASIAALYQGKASAQVCQGVADWLEGLIKREPKTVLLENLAAIRYLQQRYPEIMDIYRKMDAKGGADALILNNMAWLTAVQEKNGPEAMKLMRRALDMAGPTADLLNTRAVIYLTMGEHALAVKDLEDAAIDAPSADQYFHLALAHQLGRNDAAARQAFDEAKRLGLSENDVHPLERSSYHQLVADINTKSKRN